jgi:ABC-type branched-subunit amino acid transport system ATPase component
VTCLEIRDLSAGYGGSAVLHGITLAVEPGEIVAVLGRNGVGKSTLVSAIAGVLPVMGGTILLDGVNVTKRPPSYRYRHGLRVMRQDQPVFAELTVDDNLRLSGIDGTAGVSKLFPFLADRGNQITGTLSGGERKMLAAARSLHDPGRICVLDEPTEGLQPSNVDRLAEAIRARTSTGPSILLIEQHLDMALSVADRWLLVEKGRILDQGDVTEDTIDQTARQLAL